MASMMVGIFVAFFLALSTMFGVQPFPENNYKNDGQPAVYYGVEDGCQLIECTNGTYCAIRNSTMKYGQQPFQNYLFPKCVSSPDQVDQNTDPDGNSHVEVNGPTCNLVQCSQGFVCQVRVSIVKVGNQPYSQSIGGFPSCVSANSSGSDASGSSSSSTSVGGPGCNLIGTCPSGQQCMVATGIGKVGRLPFAQYFWPFCA